MKSGQHVFHTDDVSVNQSQVLFLIAIIPERDGAEVAHVTGLDGAGQVVTVCLTPASSPLRNVAFDVTPARLVTGLITERGVAKASTEGLSALYPEHYPKGTTG